MVAQPILARARRPPKGADAPVISKKKAVAKVTSGRLSAS